MNEHEISTGTVVVAFASGAALGACLALLFAPQSGRQTRERIGEITDEAEEYARELISKARAQMDRAGSKIEEWGDKALRYGQEKKAQASASASRAAENM